jgi:hypothetical protein
MLSLVALALLLWSGLPHAHVLHVARITPTHIIHAIYLQSR